MAVTSATATTTTMVLFQILLDIHLYNTLTGLILVYVATHIAMTVYILEGFFAQIPQDLLDAARMDGYSDFEIFWRVTMPIGAPARFARDPIEGEGPLAGVHAGLLAVGTELAKRPEPAGLSVRVRISPPASLSDWTVTVCVPAPLRSASISWTLTESAQL